MANEGDLSSLKHAIEQRYQQKYGPVLVNVDELLPLNEQSARVQVTISNKNGFITRYYGNVYYNGQQLDVRAKAI